MMELTEEQKACPHTDTRKLYTGGGPYWHCDDCSLTVSLKEAPDQE